MYSDTSSSRTFHDQWTPHLLSVLRVVAGFLFMVHGTQKLFGWPMPMGGGGPIDVTSLIGMAGLMEVVGGALMVVGLLTRPVAFLLSGEMAFAYFTRHAPRDFWPLANGGELAALYCFLFLYFSVAGAGPWSIDAWLRSQRSARQRPPIGVEHAHAGRGA